MARMKFLCDADRCIDCNACVTACKNENEVPWGINRRRVVTINDGKPGERSVSMACMHCTDPPCAAVCPTNCIFPTDDGIVLSDKDLCIGCGYCYYACPFGAPQYPQIGNFGSRGKMDKCTYCAGGGGSEAPGSIEEFLKYGSNRFGEGKLPMCAEMCSTKSLLAGDGDVGGLIGIHYCEEMKLKNPIVSIDGLELKEFDYIDIGAILDTSGAVPVVIKSLIFPTTAGVGKDWKAERTVAAAGAT